MNNNPIGIFDSGVGGLTVFSKLVKQLPNENYIYFGDTKNLPYGTKSKDELIKLAKNIFDFYAEQKAKAVIMACNTTSAVTYEVLKNDYDFIIYPVIQIAAKCISEQPIKKIGVLSTQATADSHAYRNSIQKYNNSIEVFEQGCPGWVQIVENKTFEDKESIQLVKDYLEKITENQVDKVILGCTHYPYLRNILNKFVDDNLFIDPAECFVDYIYNDLEIKNLTTIKQDYKPKFIVSAEPENFFNAAEMFYQLDKIPTVVWTCKCEVKSIYDIILNTYQVKIRNSKWKKFYLF